ncbi:MAG: hypothetical protein ABSE40_19040 [Candidatus Sulfotelmatobacter sp.]|jgi:hypothetical protein
MKKIFLLIVVPALLVAMGFAQTPTASDNTDQINIKGCLGGSDGNYTVAEDNTGKIFKITSSADLKAYVGQDVNFIGHKAGTAENSIAVTEFNMISEQCATAAAAPAATVSTTPETISTPPAAAAAPAADAPDAAVSAPVSTPPAAAAAPAATVSTPAVTASAPPAATPVHRTEPPARPRKSSATPAAAAAPAEPVSTPVADAAVPTAPVGPSSETASTPVAPAEAATKASTSRSAGLLVSVVVVVLLIGATVPLYNRWKKRRLVEQTRGQNLSFTKEAKTDPGKTDTTGGRKAA